MHTSYKLSFVSSQSPELHCPAAALPFFPQHGNAQVMVTRTAYILGADAQDFRLASARHYITRRTSSSFSAYRKRPLALKIIADHPCHRILVVKVGHHACYGAEMDLLPLGRDVLGAGLASLAYRALQEDAAPAAALLEVHILKNTEVVYKAEGLKRVFKPDQPAPLEGTRG
jgi:hypothetical protein